MVDKPFKKASIDDIKRFIGGLEKSYYAEWTKHDIMVFLKKYLHWLGREDVIGWLKIKTVKLNQAITSFKNRVHKILQRAGIRISVVLSDIFGKSGTIILNGLYQKTAKNYLKKCMLVS